MKKVLSLNVVIGKLADAFTVVKHNERKGKVVRKYNSKVTKLKVRKDWDKFYATMQSKMQKLS